MESGEPEITHLVIHAMQAAASAEIPFVCAGVCLSCLGCVVGWAICPSLAKRHIIDGALRSLKVSNQRPSGLSRPE
jgi:hypothetical protein